jgi:L-lactate dehydrogenase
VPAIVAAAPEALVLVVTDPPDPLADVARHIAGHDRVLSSGTLLRSLRFRFHLGKRLGVDARSVHAQVIGEHGTSQVYVWSTASVTGTPLLPKDTAAEAFREDVEKEVRYPNIDIIEGTGASQLGIAVVTARIVEIIARDEKLVVPIGFYQHKCGVTLSLPSRVGRKGVEAVFMPPLAAEEVHALEKSAAALRNALESIETW